MSELHRALDDIQNIRRQVANTTEFRGYGPVALAGTALLAAMASLIQALVVPEPAANPATYLAIWVTTAAACALLAGVTMWTRSRRLHSGLSGMMIGMAVQQFAPALLAGSLLTLVLARYAIGSLWMLPGLWMVVFSLGIFASCRFLPRGIIAAASWYLLTGLLTLSLGDARALSPWTMGFSFFAGQMLIASVLWTAGKVEEEEQADGNEAA